MCSFLFFFFSSLLAFVLFSAPLSFALFFFLCVSPSLSFVCLLVVCCLLSLLVAGGPSLRWFPLSLLLFRIPSCVPASLAFASTSAFFSQLSAAALPLFFALASLSHRAGHRQGGERWGLDSQQRMALDATRFASSCGPPCQPSLSMRLSLCLQPPTSASAF